jgi:hypothetical protein
MRKRKRSTGRREIEYAKKRRPIGSEERIIKSSSRKRHLKLSKINQMR